MYLTVFADEAAPDIDGGMVYLSNSEGFALQWLRRRDLHRAASNCCLSQSIGRLY